MALATVEDLVAVAGPVSDETRAERLLEMASAVAERWCRRTFSKTSAPVSVEVCDGTLRLPGGPWESITSITGPAPATTTYAASAYTLRSDNTLRRTYGLFGDDCDSSDLLRWPCGVYTVVGPHGYDPIPDDVVLAVCQIAGRPLNGPALGVTSETAGPFSKSYGPESSSVSVTEAEMVLLKPYRRRATSVTVSR